VIIALGGVALFFLGILLALVLLEWPNKQPTTTLDSLLHMMRLRSTAPSSTPSSRDSMHWRQS
jgi:hypothetical protein